MMGKYKLSRFTVCKGLFGNRSGQAKFSLTGVCFWFGNEIVLNLWVTFVRVQHMLPILTDEINHVSGHIPQLCFSALTITLTDHLLTLRS